MNNALMFGKVSDEKWHHGCEVCGGDKARPTARFCSRACLLVDSRRSAERRFWAKVQKAGDDECWLWTGGRKESYGKIFLKQGEIRTRLLAHRVSFVIANGPLPEGCSVVAHKCDNPICVNPNHLFAATVEDNVQDRQSKNRQAKGSEPGRAKVAEEIVKQIRSRHMPNVVTFKSLAEEYGLCLRQVWMIVSRRSWRHI